VESGAAVTRKPDWMPGVETIDARMLVLMRCVLAFSALAIIWLDPAEPARAVELTYLSLALYCLYSVALAYASWKSVWAAPHRALHWIDILFYAYLVSLTEGTSSIFFYFFFYAVLVAAFGWGFREGMSVTVASFVLFTSVGLAFAPAGERFELNRTLIRGIYLLVFGYMIAYLGGYEILLKRRLRLLKDVSNVWDSRFGVDQAIGKSLQQLLDFYAADSCILALRRPGDPPHHWMYQATSGKVSQSSIANAMTESAARPLFALPASVGALYKEPRRSWLRQRRHVAIDLGTHAQGSVHLDECAALANLLDTRSLLTVPYAQRDGTSGRLFVTSAARRFSVSDIEFLAQVSAALAAVFENILLTEEHMRRAAEEERAAISRDLHDTTIQPYLGLKLALEALRREIDETNPVARRIDELVEMTGATVRDLRDYTVRLRTRTSTPGEALAVSVRKHAERLARFYGIAIEVAADVPAQLDGRLAADAFQIVSEGLSNVLRHTTAKAAFVRLRCEDSALVVEIGNEASAPAAPEFMPRSIDERSRALGGRTAVGLRADGYTVVQVTLPFQ
jgi:signal transduction histidine kinase